MRFFTKISRHAAVARGDFGAMFKDLEIPPLPTAVNRLIAEINSPDPDLDRLVMLISSAPEIAAKVIKTINSSLYSLRAPVADIKQTVTLLGLDQIRSIALAYATMDALPRPRTNLFNHKAFWKDSLLKAIMARSLARKGFKDQLEQVFTATLLADLAVPVLLCAWGDYYQPVISEWTDSPKRLSEIERRHFGWDHAQASAWIVQSWDFPEEMICFLGAHNLTMEKIRENGLEDTIVVPMAVAALSPSFLKPEDNCWKRTFQAAVEWLAMDNDEFIDCLSETRETLADILELFDLSDPNIDRIFDDLAAAINTENTKYAYE